MGVIFSAFTAASKFIKKSRGKQKTRKAKDQQQQPFSSTQEQAVHEAQQGLRDEHLAAASPPTAGVGAGLEQVERKAGVHAPVPSATTSSTSKQEMLVVEKVKKDKMASDEDYASFLNKANQDPNEGVAKTQSGGKVQLKTVDKGIEVPAALKKATEDAIYVSDADEPFEPVALKLVGKGLPDEATFATLVGHPSPKDADVSILDIAEWDVQGQYKELVDATREATKGGDVRVYRIAKDGSRAEYWVVGVADGNLTGVKALAVES